MWAFSDSLPAFPSPAKELGYLGLMAFNLYRRLECNLGWRNPRFRFEDSLRADAWALKSLSQFELLGSMLVRRPLNLISGTNMKHGVPGFCGFRVVSAAYCGSF